MNVTLLGDLWSIDVKEVRIPEMFNAPNLCLANLETAIYPENASPRPKNGPCHKSNRQALSSIRRSFDKVCLSLANNHIMDYGDVGLKETLDVCERLNIVTVGAGHDLQMARVPVLREFDGMRVGIVGCCETQFGIASIRRAGVAALSPEIYSTIQRLRSEADVIIVSIHGAAELCPWPSPKWQDLLRSFIDAGAKIVHGHHSQVPQGYEAYHGGLIFYGLGSFLKVPDEWYHPEHPHNLWSVVADFVLDGGEISYSIRTVVIENDGPGVSVRLSSEAEYQKHSEYLLHCNIPLRDPVLLTGLWQEAAVRMYDLYLSWGLGLQSSRQPRPGRLSALRHGMKMAIIGAPSPAREKMSLWYHMFACENHSFAISTALGLQSGELDDLRTDETRFLVDEMMPWSVESVTSMIWPGPR